jgi:hypothetical protein
MMAKKTEGKGISVFLISVLISLVGAIFISFVLYFEHEEYVEQTGKTHQEILDESNRLRQRLGIIENFIPEALLEGMFEGGVISMTYLEVINITISDMDTKAIVFNNSGNYPLADFEVLLNDEELEPFCKPNMVFPGEKGIVVLGPSQMADWHRTGGTVEIKSAQDVSIKVRTGKTATGLTGQFVLVE